MQFGSTEGKGFIREKFMQIAVSKIKGSRFILLRNNIDLTEEQKVKLEDILKYSKRLRLAYTLKEDFRTIFEESRRVFRVINVFIGFMRYWRSQT